MLRCASKTVKGLVDAAFYRSRTRPHRIVVYPTLGRPDITKDRLVRVRRVVTGGDRSVPVVVVLTLRVAYGEPKNTAKLPRSADFECVRAYLDEFADDTVELRVRREYVAACIERSGDFQALRVLRDRISGASFADCKLMKWHTRVLAQILPATLRWLSLESCNVKGPIGTLAPVLAGLERLSGLCLANITYDDPVGQVSRMRSHRRIFGFEALAPALAKMHGLVDLDLRGVHQDGAATELACLLGAARGLRTLQLCESMSTVTVSLAMAILSLPELRELDLRRCGATFEALGEACESLARPAPALECLSLSCTASMFSGGAAPAAAFIRAVPSLKALYLQETHRDLAGTGVLIHLSESSAGPERPPLRVVPNTAMNVRVQWHHT